MVAVLLVAGCAVIGEDSNTSGMAGAGAEKADHPHPVEQPGTGHRTAAHLGTATVPQADRAGSASAGASRDGRRVAGLSIPGHRLVHEGDAAVDADLDRVVDLGARWLRLDAAWSDVETAPDSDDWSGLDRVVRAASARDMSIVLVVGTTAEWARPPGAEESFGPTTDSQRAGFAKFAATLAERYKGQVAAYEIWNEPNLPGSWSPQPDAAEYLKLLRVAYATIHRVDNTAIVMSGGTGDGDEGIDTISWYQTLYAGGLHAVSDAVAVHPYADAPDPDSGQMAAAHQVRTLMGAHGDRVKQLWGTETGAPTGGTFSVDERIQSRLLRQLYSLWSAIHGVGPLFYYTLDDFGGGDREDHFGLTRVDGSLKPAYREMQNWVSQANTTAAR